MAVFLQRKQLSLDANVVLDLAEGKDFAHDFREVFIGQGYRLFLPPTAVHELSTIYRSGGSARERGLAKTALADLRSWAIQPFDLDSTSEAVAERFAHGLLTRALIPEDEFNDGMIVAETSQAQIPVLVTSDKHLLDIDEDKLLLLFKEADLFPVRVAHPKRLLRALR